MAEVPQASAARVSLQFVAWSLGLFGLLRLHWIEVHALWPFTEMQGALATALNGGSQLPVTTTLACSGADALALCLGAIFAYPVRWRHRLAGAAAGVLVIVALNIVRIASLGRAAGSPRWFELLHLYIWPAILTLAIAGYVFLWARTADDRERSRIDDGRPPTVAALPPLGRFVALAAVFMLVFVAASSIYLESGLVLAVASFMAQAAAVILHAMGFHAVATGNLLSTDRAFVSVTQECITTPLIPVYLAAVFAFSTTWRRFAAGILAAVPLFVALGIIRLLLVALPLTLTSSLFLVHAFYQLLLGLVVVVLFGLWRHGTSSAWRPVAAGLLAGAGFVVMLGYWYTLAIGAVAPMPANDPQSAVAFFPSFQIGLYLALWISAFAGTGWRRMLAGLAVLVVTQFAVIFGLQAVTGHWDATAHVRDIRGWAVVAPMLVAVAINQRMSRRAKTQH